ncbi:PhzF family phenazine biosynthesis protein [Piscinibacter koreensis]|uniref:PhzF family phenazine biosynthesis protein n=1 Tax=Piscinibacter koreensis TaxID=2742824 RepID=A0A7Y6TUS5_9BURK|nr:PhzF family phenazine biosynthesis protein [Schlegelella koreensis]NUZ04176.1 PhzF family phenazine biosynthesis protein [Schlegelella koreensis]
MTTTFDFAQIDVFTDTPLCGNPLAVVHGADRLDAGQMQAFARWMNLSETAFLLAPTTPGADYRVRIFTTSRELPFAGHPTLGSCHAWLAAGGRVRGEDVVQECGVGLVRIRRGAGRLAFAAPPLRRSGPVDAGLLARIARALRVAPGAIKASQWVDNGPGWVAVMLGSREELLNLVPDPALLAGLELGVVAPWPEGGHAGTPHFELRAFLTTPGVVEDPVTGSLNASVAQWLIGARIAPPRYVASQGTALGRAGRVHVEQDGPTIWIGGDCVTCIRGSVTLP